jgi:hypothetical protein
VADVYQVIGSHLEHADELNEYFESRECEEQAFLSANPEWSPKGLRERLLARGRPSEMAVGRVF